MAVDRGYGHHMNQYSRKSPCYKCEEQYPKCHGECEKYLKWRDVRTKEKEDLKKYNLAVTQRISKYLKDKEREG